jgi:pyruvate/oxaloacetate carboxyltransferase
MVITTTARRSLLAAAMALFAAGCYSAECVKMGYAEGTLQHDRCVHHLNEEMTQQLNKLSEQLNKTSQQMKKNTAGR